MPLKPLLTCHLGWFYMETNMECTISLPETVIHHLEQYTQFRHKRSMNDSIAELLQYALTSIPAYFQQFDWELAEADADEEIRAGNMQAFDSVEELLADLES
jgi:hypothetical protein